MTIRRLTFVLKARVPFHDAMIRELSNHFDVSIIYTASRRGVDYFESVVERQVDELFLTSLAIPLDRNEARLRIAMGYGKSLSSQEPDLLLVHSWDPDTWCALRWARRHRVPVVMWAESTRWSGVHRGRLAQHLRMRAVAAAGAFVASGVEAAEFLTDLGVSDERVVRGSLPIDGDRFAPRRSEPSADKGAPTIRVLFVGRLVTRKRPHDVIDLHVELVNRGCQVETTIVGDGPLSSSLCMRIQNIEKVSVAGWMEGAELALAYQEADVVYVPSEREVWGLVVNEALASGVYVVASTQVGSAYDLLRSDGSNGSVVPVGDVRAAADAILRYASSIGRHALRQISIEHSPGAYDATFFADAVLRASQLAEIDSK